MGFGIYIHVPYCIQKCHYCDFTTFSLNHQIKMSQYTQLVLSEIRTRHKDIPHRQVQSVYFGGGTPSLLPVEDILSILKELANAGFEFSKTIEITIEINPGTIDPQRLDQYKTAGINRFSVGVQTFNDQFLKATGREHSAKQTTQDLALLKSFGVSFSVDLLFGLPKQSLSQLEDDLDEFVSVDPDHLSAYNLTVPSGHPLDQGRATDQTQAKMFEKIAQALQTKNILRYELSNYSKPGKEGQHNSLYWNDGDYWGIGISAHSYFKNLDNKFGIRFWNSPVSSLYQKQLEQTVDQAFYKSLPKNQFESLAENESLTDYCHTQLRKVKGLSWAGLKAKFGESRMEQVNQRFHLAISKGLVEASTEGFRLTKHGFNLANQSFLEFTFLPEDLRP